MMEFKIKRGYKRYLIDENNNPLIPLEDGCWYLTLDTVEIFVAINGQLKPLNQAEINLDDYDERFEDIEARLAALESRTPEQEVITFAEYSQFPTIGAANILYIALDKNASYIYNSDRYICVGTSEVGPIEIEIINGGSAKN